MTRTAIALSKLFIVVLAAGGVLVQMLLLPMQADESAALFPEVAFLKTPFLILGVLFVLCGQVVLFCIWMLLSLVRENAIFSARAFKYVNTMIGSLVVATLIVVAVPVILDLTSDASPPPFLFIGGAFACAGLALVLVVMRSLLVKASEQAHYLAEVV